MPSTLKESIFPWENVFSVFFHAILVFLVFLSVAYSSLDLRNSGVCKKVTFHLNKIRTKWFIWKVKLIILMICNENLEEEIFPSMKIKILKNFSWSCRLHSFKIKQMLPNKSNTTFINRPIREGFKYSQLSRYPLKIDRSKVKWTFLSFSRITNLGLWFCWFV